MSPEHARAHASCRAEHVGRDGPCRGGRCHAAGAVGLRVGGCASAPNGATPSPAASTGASPGPPSTSCRPRTRTRCRINCCSSRVHRTHRHHRQRRLCVPEADYFTKLNTELAGGVRKHDAFIARCLLHLAVRYAPPGWVEDLRSVAPEQFAATSAEYDFEDIFERPANPRPGGTSSLGNPPGQRRAVGHPVGFREQRGRLQQADLRREGIKLPDNFDDFIQLAVDLTDRADNRYGMSTRGSKSWATIHPVS